jgi:hypothetical protein
VREKISDDTADATALQTAILGLHVDLLVGLTAADFRLGKAYGLGRALADTCAPSHGQSVDELRKSVRSHLDPHRALVLVGWLDDLKTVLPDHAGQSVSDSLQRWIRWGEEAGLDDATEKEVRRVAPASSGLMPSADCPGRLDPALALALASSPSIESASRP